MLLGELMPEPLTFLYIKPDYDEDSIKYLVLTEPVRDYAQKIGYQVIDLEGEYAKPEYIYSAIEQYDPYIVFGSGHGCTHLMTAQDYMDTFWATPGCGEHPKYDNSLDMLSGRVTFLLSCYCGANLIPSIVANGGVAGVGFSDEFTWVVDTDYTPTEDPFALSFYDPPNYFMSLILDGVSVAEAHNKTKARYDLLIATWKKWITDNQSAHPADASRAYLALSLLEHDKSILTSIGEGFNLESETVQGSSFLLLGTAMLGAILLNYWIKSQPSSSSG